MLLNVNIKGLEDYTRKLQGLHRSALPVAIRGALNGAAFDVKQRTMLQSAKDSFEERKPNFFKATSTVVKATGFNVEQMQSTVGFKGNQQSVSDLEAQEEGGSIGGRSFIPMNPARSGGSHHKLVKPNAQLKRIKLVDAAKAKGKNDAQKFIKSVFFAGKGGMVLSEYKGQKIVWKINSLNRTDEGNLKLTPLYTYEKGRAVKIDSTHFMWRAALKSGQKIGDLYVHEAQRQIAKFMK